ncbi:hypothetical protein LGM65_18950 [Burkholderia anthina]|uniref:hypothetical protein n=1 Tax=Burkholderia anthina TaxID=179879 RepID=UPI001CF102F3|nr:hypothetical protein [Burkholderia anthina]MCA8092936.1 hypothetical protein [Burkholderia anthina]
MAPAYQLADVVGIHACAVFFVANCLAIGRARRSVSDATVSCFEHRASLARDVATARDVWAALRFVMLPPGWRPDNRGETTEELRRRNLVAVRTAA